MNKIVNSTDNIPLFGHYLIRDVLMDELLGENKESILYWAGKSLARKYPLTTLEEIGEFFVKSGWGNLILKKESKSEITLELQSIFQPYHINPGYQLGAGFIAEQIQNQKGFITEAAVTVNKKSILFSVKWDIKDQVDHEYLIMDR